MKFTATEDSFLGYTGIKLATLYRKKDARRMLEG
jgi:hypothetical protein